MRARPARLVVALVAVCTLTLSACLGGSSGKPAGPTGDQVTALPTVSSGTTTIALDPGSLAVFQSLGVKLGLLGRATESTVTAGASPGPTLSFPITAGYLELHSSRRAKPGYVQGQLEHDTSGFTLSAGDTTLRLSNLVIDPGNSLLYGTVDDSRAAIPLLTLNGARLRSGAAADEVTLSGTVATLTQTAATAIDTTFKTNAIRAGFPLGVAAVVARGSGLVRFPAAGASAMALGGQSTEITLDADTGHALSTLGLTVTPLGTAKQAPGALSFPITGGFLSLHSDRGFRPGFLLGSVNHEGSGLQFSGRGRSLVLGSLVIDPGASLLTAVIPDARGGGTILPLLTLDGTNVKVVTSATRVTVDGTNAELTAQAAQVLNATFAVNAFHAGRSLGIVHLVATPATP